MSEYKHPEVLVSTDWAAQNLNAPNTRFVGTILLGGKSA